MEISTLPILVAANTEKASSRMADKEKSRNLDDWPLIYESKGLLPV